MSDPTQQLAHQLPVFRSQNYQEVQDFNEFLKLVQRLHIQKFILKSKEQLFNYLIQQCQIQAPCSESEESIKEDEYEELKQEIKGENKIGYKQDKIKIKQEEQLLRQQLQQPLSLLENQEMQYIQNPVAPMKIIKNQKIEEKQKNKRKETNQILENLKQTLPFTQEFDDDSLKRLVHDFQQEDRGNKRERHTQYNRDGLIKDDLQGKFSPNKIKILHALTLMIQEEIAYPKILQAFQIQTKTYYYTVMIKDNDDVVNSLQQRIKEYGSDIKKQTHLDQDKKQIDLIYEMMVLLYEKREQHKEQIVSFCSGVVFQKKLKLLKDKIEQKLPSSGKVCKSICEILERIAEFVYQGPVQKYVVGNSQEAQLMHQKIIKRAAKSLLLTAYQLDVPVPEVLQYISLRKSKYNNQSNPDDSLGIYILPSIDFVKVIIDKQGMEKVQEQLKVHDIEFFDFKKLDQLCFDQSVGFSNCEEKGETILYQTLDLVLQRIGELDQLRFVINDRKFKALQQKLNEVYKEDAFLEPNQELDLTQYVVCVMNKIEFHAKKNLPEEKTQVNVCFIKIKNLLGKKFQIRNNEQDLNDAELDQCKNLLFIFLWNISNKDIAIPDILQFFKIVDGKMYFEFSQKLVGIMLLSKQISNYFVTCMNMNLQIDKEVIEDVTLIKSVPLLDLEINEDLLPNIVDIFSKQVSILYQNRASCTDVLIEFFKNEKVISLIKSYSADCEGEEAIIQLKFIQKYVSELQSIQKIKQDDQ